MRHITQIVSNDTIALCDDGTAWILEDICHNTRRCWNKLPEILSDVDYKGILAKSIREALPNLSVRTRKGLHRLGLVTVGELTTCSEVDLLSCKNFGKYSLREVKDSLRKLNLYLGVHSP